MKEGVQSLHPYAPEGGLKGLPACFSHCLPLCSACWVKIESAGWEDTGSFDGLDVAWATSHFSPPVKLFHADPGVIVWLFTWAFPGTCEAYLPGSGRERVGENAISWMSFGIALK